MMDTIEIIGLKEKEIEIVTGGKNSHQRTISKEMEMIEKKHQWMKSSGNFSRDSRNECCSKLNY